MIKDFNQSVSIYQAVAWHLQANMYPPVPKDFVMPCVRAIEAYVTWDSPTAKVYHAGGYAEAWEVIEAFNLKSFVDSMQYGEEYEAYLDDYPEPWDIDEEGVEHCEVPNYKQSNHI